MNCHEWKQYEEIEQELSDVSEGNDDHLNQKAKALKKSEVKVYFYGKEEKDCCLEAENFVIAGVLCETGSEIANVDECQGTVDEVPEVVYQIL